MLMNPDDAKVMVDLLLQRGVPYDVVQKVLLALEPGSVVLGGPELTEWMKARSPSLTAAIAPTMQVMPQADAALIVKIIRMRSPMYPFDLPVVVT